MKQRGPLITILAVVHLTWIPTPTSSFILPCHVKQHSQLYAGNDNKSKSKPTITEEELKQKLTEYLAKRKEENADQAAEAIKGTIVGGTRGNAILDFVSGAPVKERIIERAPDIFDYDELSKYGYSNLATPIMGLVGGRRSVYELMGIEAPPLLGPPPKKKFEKLKFDRTGEDDKARYTGLKMGQVLDDNIMGEALALANKKAKQGDEMRPKLMEETYVQPFAGTLRYSIDIVLHSVLN